MRAFDAAVYFTGKEPYYFVYPEKYFPPRVSNWLKEDVQRQAKEYAEKTDDLKENEASFLGGHSKLCSVEAAKKLPPSAEVKKPVELMEEEFKQLDENLQNAEYLNLEVPKELSLDFDVPDWVSWLMSERPVEDSNLVSEEAIAAAYRRGYSDPEDWTTLIDNVVLPVPQDIPLIESEGSFFDFKDVDFKRKREASEGAYDHKCVCYPADTIDVADIVTTGGFFTEFDFPLPHHVSLKRKPDASEEACDRKRVAISRDAVSVNAATTVAGDDWIANLFNNHPSLLCG
jgi:hypothetical protein